MDLKEKRKWEKRVIKERKGEGNRMIGFTRRDNEKRRGVVKTLHFTRMRRKRKGKKKMAQGTF